jgi:hypothetical protein
MYDGSIQYLRFNFDDFLKIKNKTIKLKLSCLCLEDLKLKFVIVYFFHRFAHRHNTQIDC